MAEEKIGPSLIWMSWTEDGEHHAVGTSQLADMGTGDGIDPWAVLGLDPEAGVEAARAAHQRIIEELAAQSDDDDADEEQNARDVEKLRTLFTALAMIEAHARSEKTERD